MPPPLQAVVFDIGEVLIKLNFSKIMEMRGMAPHTSLSEWLHRMNTWDLYDAFERGTLTESAFIEGLQKNLNLSLDHTTFLTDWNSVLRETVPEVEEILAHLRKHLPLYALTNSNETHIRHAHAHYPVMAHFKKVFTSYELAARKPEKEIYLKVEEALALPGKHILFLDDRPENVAGARSVGWNAEQCLSSPADIKTILKKYGLPLPGHG